MPLGFSVRGALVVLSKSCFGAWMQVEERVGHEEVETKGQII